MTIYRCDVCGKECRSILDHMVFTSIKRRYWIFTTQKEEILDVCTDCQRDLRAVLDKKAREYEAKED